MPAPATNDEFIGLVVKSGVAEHARLHALLATLRESNTLPPEPSQLANVLVDNNTLTRFQADQLLQGKWKRFAIGKYRVLDRLGSGGMAQVFLCEHTFMRRRVAVKVLPAAKAADPASLERFYREARAVAALDHPNIVRAYDIDQDDGLHFLVMEYVDGTNLQDLIRIVGPLDPTRACHYIYGAAVGLQHAHETGLIHRDIKPGNILVDRAGVVKVLDMGLARFFHDNNDRLTRKYDEFVLGTADYAAPEQALDSHTVDIRADIYSLGATFYFLLTTRPVFDTGSVAQKMLWHQTRDPDSVRSLRPDIPAALAELIETMMAKDRDRRFQTPAELLSALAPWVTSPIAPPSERELPQASRKASSGVSTMSGRTIPGTINPTVTTDSPPPQTPNDGAATRTEFAAPSPTGPDLLSDPPPPSSPTNLPAATSSGIYPGAQLAMQFQPPREPEDESPFADFGQSLHPRHRPPHPRSRRLPRNRPYRPSRPFRPTTHPKTMISATSMTSRTPVLPLRSSPPSLSRPSLSRPNPHRKSSTTRHPSHTSPTRPRPGSTRSGAPSRTRPTRPRPTSRPPRPSGRPLAGLAARADAG